jgi:hypothetical protein
MNKYFRKVLEMLKTNKDIKALGFSRKELKGIAANVADKLELKDDATDDDVDEAVSDAIDNVLPFLKFTQSAVDRQVQEYKNPHPKDDDDDDEPDEGDEPSRKKPSKSKKDGKAEGDDTKSAFDELKELFQQNFSKLSERMDAYEKDKTANGRKAKVESMLKGTGRFGERKLRAFSRMSFEDEESFEDYLDELQEELDEENQERANKGLETLGNPPAGNQPKKDDDELMSDDEIKALAQG